MAACNFDIPQQDCTLETCCLQQGTVSYLPNVAGNALFAAIFFILFIFQLVLGIKYKTWSFLVGMSCGLILEILGYSGRVWMNNSIFDLNPFLMYLICLTIGPVFLSASVYLCLSRIISVSGRSISRLSPRAYSIIFICSDVVSLLLQAAGGAIAAMAGTDITQGELGAHIMVAGLAFQVFSLLVFMGLCLDFANRFRKAKEYEKNGDCTSLRLSQRFRGFVIATGIATIFIFIRSVYRVAELQGGFASSLANDEVAFMILEGPMIIIAVASLTLYHPGLCLQGQWKLPGKSDQGSQAVKYSSVDMNRSEGEELAGTEIVGLQNGMKEITKHNV